MNRYLVTGGLGFIGYNLVLKLLENEDNFVFVYDDMRSGCPEKELRFLLNHPHCSVSKHDITTTRLPEVDTVFHLASSIGSKHLPCDPNTAIQNNTRMMFNILHHYEETAHIIYSSSIEVVTGLSPEIITENSPVGWSNLADQRWGYSVSKFIPEITLTTSKATWTVARFTNVYGPHPRHEYVIPALIRRIKPHETTIIERADDSRCFVYVDDVVNGLLKIAANPYGFKTVFTIGNDQEVTIEEVGRLIKKLKAPSANLKFKYTDNPEWRSVSLDKARDILGYSPTISIEEGLQKTINSYASP